jgi:hypothetical protein
MNLDVAGLSVLALAIGCHQPGSKTVDAAPPRPATVAETIDVGGLGLPPEQQGNTIGLGNPSDARSRERKPVRAAPGAVVVRTAHPAHLARFSVHCLAGERLVGGGCGGGCVKISTSEPIDYGETDSIASGWTCKCEDELTPNASTVFALCQGLPGPAPR